MRDVFVITPRTHGVEDSAAMARGAGLHPTLQDCTLCLGEGDDYVDLIEMSQTSYWTTTMACSSHSIVSRSCSRVTPAGTGR